MASSIEESKFTTHFRATLDSSIYGGALKVTGTVSTKIQRIEYVSSMDVQNMNTVIKPDVPSCWNSQVMRPNRINSLCRDQSLCYFRRITSCSPIANKPLSSVVPDLNILPQEVTGLGSIGDRTWFLRAREALLRSSTQGTVPPQNCSLGMHVVSDNASKRTALHHASNPLHVQFAFQAGQVSGLEAKPAFTCTDFQGLRLVTAKPSKPRSARRNKQRSTCDHRKPTTGRESNRSRATLLKELTGIASEVIGTTVSADAPLMEAGLDSIGAAELQNKMSEHLDMELPPTLLFDHPTLQSVANFLSLDNDLLPVEAERVDPPDKYFSDE